MERKDEKRKMSTEELCSQPVDPDLESWEEMCPGFAEQCNYNPDAKKTEKS